MSLVVDFCRWLTAQVGRSGPSEPSSIAVAGATFYQERLIHYDESAGKNAPHVRNGVQPVRPLIRFCVTESSARNLKMRDPSDFDVLSFLAHTIPAPDHWQTHWEAAFSNMLRVGQDDWEVPVYSDWSFRLTETVNQWPTARSVVAHRSGNGRSSLAGRKRLHQAVAGAFLVATSECRSARLQHPVSDAWFRPRHPGRFRFRQWFSQP